MRNATLRRHSLLNTQKKIIASASAAQRKLLGVVKLYFTNTPVLSDY
jgi:hypothetical protein